MSGFRKGTGDERDGQLSAAAWVRRWLIALNCGSFAAALILAIVSTPRGPDPGSRAVRAEC